jgi:hypothetical protein
MREDIVCILRARGIAKDSAFRRLMSLGDRSVKVNHVGRGVNPATPTIKEDSFPILRARGITEDSAFRRLMSLGERSVKLNHVNRGVNRATPR